MSLIPLMKLRLATPTVLVDVGRVRDLSYVRDAGDHIAIGALTRHRDLETERRCSREQCGVLRAVAAQVGDNQVRHRGTIGGSVAHGDPASDLPAALLALDATFVARGPERRARRSRRPTFFQGFLETALAPDELLTEIRVPKTGAERLRVPEVQPAGPGLGDRRRARGARERRHARRARQHGPDAAARVRGRGGARAGRDRSTDAAARAAEGTEPTGRPQRVARVPRAPRPRPRPPRARSRLNAWPLGHARLERRGACSRPGRGRALRRRRPQATARAATAGHCSRTRSTPRVGERRSRPVVVVVSRPSAVAASTAPRRRRRGRAQRRDRERGIASSLQVALRALDTAAHGRRRSSSVSPTSRSSAPTRTAASPPPTTTAPDSRSRPTAARAGNPVLLGRQLLARGAARSPATKGRGCSCAATVRPRYRATAPATRPTSTRPTIWPRWRNDRWRSTTASE